MDAELDPIEALRFFCSQHFPGQAWLDSETLFDAVMAAQGAVEAAERERIAQHFDARDRGPDGKPLGLGFYDPHEPAAIIRALRPNVGIDRPAAFGGSG